MDERGSVQKWKIIIGRLQRVAPMLTEIRGVIGFGICIFTHSLSMYVLKVIIPRVAQKESQNHASYSGARGLIQTSIMLARPRDALPEPCPQYSIIRYDKTPIIIARITETSSHTRNP